MCIRDSKKIAATKDGEMQSYTRAKLTKGTYYYKIRSYVTVDGTKYYSPYSLSLIHILGVILFNIGHIPAVFASIVEGAFHPAAVTGGAVGSFFMSMKDVYKRQL